MDYKATLNLPETAFPMKADLAKKEPEMLRSWAESKLYARILEARKNAPPYVLHDGPPYANGHLHYGHILNKTLKDIVCKYRTMAGHYVEYKPGWDCHGLPIELAVQRALGDKIASMTPVQIRAACHDYAMKFVGIQRDEFIRLGVFGTWDDPYLTLAPHYEATIVRQLAEFARKGMLYQAKKPVHWCMSDKTALAEAEIEYDEKHVSPSIYVKFATPEPGLFAVIWTTTPWTLPANWAIVYHPEFAYVTVRANGERYIVAERLADAVVAACKLTEDGPREPFAVDKFVAFQAARHPFLDRPSRFLAADYVTLEQGTGLVHTAPGHGADDFATGKKYGLPVEAPVDDGGKFSDGPWKGEFIFKANPKIVALLVERHALLSHPDAKVTHAYPICWRCKNPVIFRATEQLFARLDGDTHLRETALAEIRRTRWIPPWGENRIAGMIENRPDWVLSRQRVWGVPIPVFYKDGEAVIDAALMDKVADRFEKDGADAWFASSTAELLGPEHAQLEKGRDIVDVWFESGVSWAAVCEGEKSVGLDSSTAEDRRPIDLYLEGSDQHRGWFHSSLLASCATRGRAPYRAVLTHGFVLDEKGRPYSKSDIERRRQAGEKVEYIEPDTVLKQQGAELLRMWTAQADFRSDMMYSRAHLTQLGESYRKLRNTMRFLLGNLFDFDPTRDTVPAEGLTDLLDRYVYGRANELESRLRKAYDEYEFHVVLRALVDFCATDLSSLYLDVRKDRLYCDGATSPERRATQTVMYRALRVVTTALAPICCFTAEEIWSYMPKLGAYDPESVHLVLLGAGGDGDAEANAMIERLLEVRARVQKELEPFRAQKKSSLDAHVTITVPADAAEVIGRLPQGWLADFLIVSKTTVKLGELAVTVADATGNRCDRCWKWTDAPPPLCARCQAAVTARGAA